VKKHSLIAHDQAIVVFPRALIKGWVGLLSRSLKAFTHLISPAAATEFMTYQSSDSKRQRA